MNIRATLILEVVLSAGFLVPLTRVGATTVTPSLTRTPTCTPGESPHPGCPYSPAPTTRTPSTPTSTPTATPTCTPQAISTCRQDQTITCTDLGGDCVVCACVTQTPAPRTLTPTPSCVPTLGIASYCATHCDPCPTVRAGCNAVACGDCIEIPVCAPDETCVPWNPANPGCCSCATATATPSTSCVGDCNGDEIVAINELITGVNIELNGDSGSACPALNCNTHFGVHIDCLILAVNNALNGCPRPTATAIPSSTPTTTALEATPTVSPTVRIAFTVAGCVDEFPNEPCGQPGFTVQLDPLGLTDQSPDFRFANIPPGAYVLSVHPGCNPFGCWEEVPVTITDHDVYVHIALSPNPTSTPLPTATVDVAATPTPDPLLAALLAPFESACRPLDIGGYPPRGYADDDGYELLCEKRAGHGNRTTLRRYPSALQAADAFASGTTAFEPIALAQGVPAASHEAPFPPSCSGCGKEVTVLWQLECWVATVRSHDDTEYRFAPNAVALSNAILANAGDLLRSDCPQ